MCEPLPSATGSNSLPSCLGSDRVENTEHFRRCGQTSGIGMTLPAWLPIPSKPLTNLVPNHPVMQLDVFRSLAVKEQERVDEQWQVRKEGDVKGTVFLDEIWRNFEVVGEVQVEIVFCHRRT